jgi:hypothetical protein
MPCMLFGNTLQKVFEHLIINTNLNNDFFHFILFFYLFCFLDGREKFGPKFTSIQDFVSIHSLASNDIRCDEFHDGSGIFLNIHCNHRHRHYQHRNHHIFSFTIIIVNQLSCYLACFKGFSLITSPSQTPSRPPCALLTHQSRFPTGTLPSKEVITTLTHALTHSL